MFRFLYLYLGQVFHSSVELSFEKAISPLPLFMGFFPTPIDACMRVKYSIIEEEK